MSNFESLIFNTNLNISAGSLWGLDEWDNMLQNTNCEILCKSNLVSGLTLTAYFSNNKFDIVNTIVFLTSTQIYNIESLGRYVKFTVTNTTLSATTKFLFNVVYNINSIVISNPVIVSGITNPVTLNSLPAGTNNIGDVDVVSCVLPTGASSEITLAAINTKTPSLGQALETASTPVVLTAAQLTTLTPLSTIAVSGITNPVTLNSLPAGNNNIGDVDVVSCVLPTGASSEITLATINTKTPSLGQALAGASTPVVLTAAQLTTLTPLASVAVSSSTLPTGASTEATLSTLNGKTPALGQALAGLSVPVVLTAAQLNEIKPLATQPVSGTVAISNTSFEVSNFTPSQAGNCRGISDVIVGNWYKVISLGTSVYADWLAVGALNVGEAFPQLGRVFKALSISGTGTGSLSTLIYSQNVVLSAAQLATLTPLTTVAISNTSLADPYLQTSKSLIAGSTPVFVSGVNFSNGGTEDIWGSSVAAWITPTAASTVNITSSSASDAAAGVGARTVSITGLNGSYAEVTETITMNGISNVATSNSYFIINKMVVLTAGSSETAVGTIISTWTGGGTPVGPNIVIGANESQAAIYQVPVGYSLYVTNYTVGSNAGGQAVHSLMAKPFGGLYNLKQSTPTNVNSNNGYKSFNPPMKFIEKTTVKLQSLVNAGMECYGSFDGVLVAN